MRKTPSYKEKTKTGKTPKPLEDFLLELWGKVAKDDDDRTQWKNKMVASSNQRLGVKRYSNFPYENAPDFPLPETDKLIKKSTPNLVLSSWKVKKLATVSLEQGVEQTPELLAAAKRAELGLNMVLRSKMSLFRKLEQAADYAKEKGHCIFKVVEEFKSRKVPKVIDLDEFPEDQVEQLKALDNEDLELFIAQRYNFDLEDKEEAKTVKDILAQFKSGDNIIEFQTEEISSQPNIEVPDPLKIIVPSYTTDLQHSYRLTEEFYLNRQEIEDRINQEIYLERDLDDLTTNTSDSTTRDYVELSKMRNEGIEDSNSGKDLFRIRESLCWYKPEDSDCFERWVFTYLADVANPAEALLRRIPYPFEFDEWNYDRFDNEIKDPRHYSSRGTPEQIRAMQEVMEKNLNNMILRDEMNNNPIWEVLDTSEILVREKRFKPGALVPVSQLGAEIRQLNSLNTVDVSSERMMQLLKAWTEEYLGSTDQLFRNATNSGGGKTLGEIQTGIRQVAGQTSVDVVRWNDTLSNVFYKIFLILRERTGNDYFVDGIKITKEDFNIPACVTANGNLEVADADMLTQKAYMRLQVINQHVQFGIVDQEDQFHALRDWLEKDGVVDPDLYTTDPQQINQTQLAQQQQQLQQLGQQLQQGQAALDDITKDVSKARKRGNTIVKKTEGELEAMYEGSDNTKP